MTALTTSGDYERAAFAINQRQLGSPSCLLPQEENVSSTTANRGVVSRKTFETTTTTTTEDWSHLGWLDKTAVEMVLRALNDSTATATLLESLVVSRTQMCAMELVCDAIGVDFSRAIGHRFVTSDALEHYVFVAGERGTLHFSDDHVFIDYWCERTRQLSTAGRFAYRIDSQTDRGTCFWLFSAVPMALRLLPGGSVALELYALDGTLVHSDRFDRRKSREGLE